MKRLGVVLSPDPTIPRRAFAVLNPAVIMDDQGRINIYPREVACRESCRSTIGWDVFNLEHELLYSHDKPVTGSDCHEDPRIVRIEEDSQHIMSFTEAIKDPTEESWKTNILLKVWGNNPDDYEIIRPKLPGSDNNKNGVLFPRKINGKYWILHRIRPDIYLACSDNLIDWQDFGPIMKPIPGSWQASHIGAGTPPIETCEGWLLFYHGAFRFRNGSYRYSMFTALLDLNDPTKVLYRPANPILAPQENYETTGWVNNVVFPCGAIKIEDTYRIYYGGADSVVACCEFTEKEIFERLAFSIPNAPLEGEHFYYESILYFFYFK